MNRVRQVAITTAVRCIDCCAERDVDADGRPAQQIMWQTGYVGGRCPRCQVARRRAINTASPDFCRCGTCEEKYRTERERSMHHPEKVAQARAAWRALKRSRIPASKVFT